MLKTVTGRCPWREFEHFSTVFLCLETEEEDIEVDEQTQHHRVVYNSLFQGHEQYNFICTLAVGRESNNNRAALVRTVRPLLQKTPASRQLHTKSFVVNDTYRRTRNNT